jgi:hypothetical protein
MSQTRDRLRRVTMAGCRNRLRTKTRPTMNTKRTLTLLSVYAVAMALLESAVVVYMRYLYSDSATC